MSHAKPTIISLVPSGSGTTTTSLGIEAEAFHGEDMAADLNGGEDCFGLGGYNPEYRVFIGSVRLCMRAHKGQTKGHETNFE
jgi:hypothetical protein